jgi:ABC-type multidrug transport system fused ATPase/permease subunit
MSSPQPPESIDSTAPATTRERLRAVLGEKRGTVLALAICSLVSGFTEATILALIAQIATAAVKGASHVQVRLGPVHLSAPIGTLFAVAFALTIARVALQAPLAILPARIAADVQARFRTGLFDAFTRASWATQSQDREGLLQETMTSQVLQATVGAMQATQLVIAGFTFIVLMAFAVAANAVAALVVLAAAVLLFGLLRPLNVVGQRRARALSLAQVEYAGGVSEAGRLAEDTQVFGVAGAQRERVGALIATARRLFYQSQVIGRLAPSLYQSVIYLVLVAGIFALYSQGSSQRASLGAVVLLIVRAGTYGQQVQGAYQGLRQSLPFIERLQEAQRRYLESSPPAGATPLPRVETLAFESVSYAYRTERPVLSDISFEVGGSEAVGIIGPSGAGKSTLVQILLQLRSPDAGRYLVNGLPAAEYVREDWHRRVAYVPQEPRLVHASVAENIRYFRDLDDEAVERAGRLARIHDDIMSWPQGYQTIVGPRADAVSGGQQQRICLARALAARPEVLILDEPTSALDPHSETLIQESLSALKADLSLFIVAHRMSTLDICDRVMVIVSGRLVAFDTKALLQTENSYYRNASMIAAGTPGGALP